MFSTLFLFACLGGGFAPCLLAAGSEPSTFPLVPAATVDGEGVFLRQIVASDAALAGFENVRVADAPPCGRALAFDRAQLTELLRAAVPDLVCTNWTGATTIRITRRARAFGEADLLALLTAALQQDYVKDRGELELRLSRPWPAQTVPDEVLAVKVLDLPNTGVTPAFIVRFELRTARETVGTWQASVQARVWREAWVARSALKRGELVADAGVARERRDVLGLRETLADFLPGDATLEMAEPLQAGAPLLARSIKLRPVIRRGQVADARIKDGAMQITMKVEALEDGAPGQTIRARNPISRRDLSGKVLNEQTILISL
jgi:flagella basal body P-ring formation protein FlgA